VDAQANALQLEQAQQGRAANAANFSELLQQSKEAMLRTEEGFDNLRREETQRQKQYVLKWLSAADAMSDQDHHRDCRKSSDSGQWLLQNKRFRAWHDTDSLSAPLLWVTGIPGAGNSLVQNASRLQELTLHAGKSVLASIIFDQSSKLPNTAPVVFFCKGDDLEKNTFVGMARSILHQLLLGEETLLQYLFQAATTEGETQLRTTKLARELLNTCLRAAGRVYAVIDGIDECQQIEQQHIVKFWITYVEHASSETWSPASVLSLVATTFRRNRCSQDCRASEFRGRTTNPTFARTPYHVLQRSSRSSGLLIPKKRTLRQGLLLVRRICSCLRDL
jgi:hypothetical protein